ncbi:MAG: EscN/YscN/HrcN family type III secretion system ATPase, partial [Polyangiales bacterium]
MDDPLEAARARLGLTLPTRAVQSEGRLVGMRGLTLRAVIPGVRAGDRVVIDGARPVDAEVVGFDEDHVVLLPLGDTRGLGLDDRVRSAGSRSVIGCSAALLGRVIDASGDALDGAGPIAGTLFLREVDASPPPAMRRGAVGPRVETGVRVIDGLLTLARGQRLGLFAGAGVGKSSLLATLARGFAADVVVVGLVGERGRELREFVDALGPEGMRRAVVVGATSDAPALVRVRAAQAATAVAEHFRDEGRSVLLLVDSLTRVARAQREVGLAAGEPAVRRGLPPSVYATLPRLIERAGPGERGAITAVYTVLVEGGDLDEPVADEVRGLVDGHVV